MAQAITVSLPDDLKHRLDDELDGYGDNRSAIVREALREYLEVEA